MNDAVSQIPLWWLILSAVFFAIVALLFLALCALVFRLIGVVSTMEPQVHKLIDQVNDLVPTVKQLVVKVEALTEKVDHIADSTKDTVDVVGTRAKSLASTADHVATLAAAGFQRFAPIIGALTAAVRIYSLVREVRGDKKEKVEDEDEHGRKPKKGILGRRRGVEQSGSSSGS